MKQPNSSFLRFFLFLLLFSIPLFFLSAQTGVVQGYVQAGSQPLEFATVAVYSTTSQEQTTTQEYLINGTYTDRSGQYRIENLTWGTYRIVASTIGYQEAEQVITIDSLHPSVKASFNLIIADQQLSEVVVQAQRKDGVGKRAFRFDKEQKKRASKIQDLACSLPRLKSDPVSGRIVSASGEGAPLILLNGVISSEEEIKMIPPGKVIRIDYYDLPPIRLNTTGSVIDIITAPLDNGHSGGFELGTVPLATDAIGRAYYGYNRGRHRIKFFANGFYRNTRLGREEDQETSYTADNVPYSFVYNKKEKFRTLSQTFKGTYSYTQPGKQTFHASIIGTYDDFKGSTKLSSLFSSGIQKVSRTGETKNSSTIFTPVVDLYYSRSFANNSVLYTNVVFTQNSVRQEMDTYERTSLPSTSNNYQEQLWAENDKSSIITQIDYALPVHKMWLRTGLQGMYSQALFRIKGSSLSLPVRDLQRQYRQRVYATLEGNLSKLSFRVAPALSLAYASAHDQQPQGSFFFFFTPTAQILYTPGGSHRLRLNVEANNYVPELGQTTRVIRQIREGLYYRNNPDLNNSYRLNSRLRYSWNNQYIDTEATFSYTKIYNDLIVQFSKESVNGKEVVVQHPDNAQHFQQIEQKIEVAIMPLGNETLAIRFYARPRHQQYLYKEHTQESLFSIPMGSSIAYRYRRWGIQADCSFPHKVLRSSFVSTSDWYSAVATFYNYKNWSFRLSLENLFRKEQTTSENHKNLLVQEKINTQMHDNFWRLGIGISYDFSIGKEFNSSKNLDNEDTDKGSL